MMHPSGLPEHGPSTRGRPSPTGAYQQLETRRRRRQETAAYEATRGTTVAAKLIAQALALTEEVLAAYDAGTTGLDRRLPTTRREGRWLGLGWRTVELPHWNYFRARVTWSAELGSIPAGHVIVFEFGEDDFDDDWPRRGTGWLREAITGRMAELGYRSTIYCAAPVGNNPPWPNENLLAYSLNRLPAEPKAEA